MRDNLTTVEQGMVRHPRRGVHGKEKQNNMKNTSKESARACGPKTPVPVIVLRDGALLEEPTCQLVKCPITDERLRAWLANDLTDRRRGPLAGLMTRIGKRNKKAFDSIKVELANPSETLCSDGATVGRLNIELANLVDWSEIIASECSFASPKRVKIDYRLTRDAKLVDGKLVRTKLAEEIVFEREEDAVAEMMAIARKSFDEVKKAVPFLISAYPECAVQTTDCYTRGACSNVFYMRCGIGENFAETRLCGSGLGVAECTIIRTQYIR